MDAPTDAPTLLPGREVPLGGVRGMSVQRWLPRDIDPTTISSPQLKAICDCLNATPRKCLGWRTPAEVFRQELLASEPGSGSGWAEPPAAQCSRRG